MCGVVCVCVCCGGGGGVCVCVCVWCVCVCVCERQSTANKTIIEYLLTLVSVHCNGRHSSRKDHQMFGSDLLLLF